MLERPCLRLIGAHVRSTNVVPGNEASTMGNTVHGGTSVEQRLLFRALNEPIDDEEVDLLMVCSNMAATYA